MRDTVSRRFKKYCSFNSKLVSYFHKNKAYRGIVKVNEYAGAVKEAMIAANSKKDKTNKGKWFKKGVKYSKRKYSVLRDGCVFQFRDENQQYTVLRADGYNSEYLGKSDVRDSTRPQTFRKTNWRCNYMYHYFRKVLEDYDLDIDKCVIISGCYYTNLHTIQRTMIPEVKGSYSKMPSIQNVKIFNNVAKVLFRKMKMYERLETPTFEDIYYTKVNKEKKPGFRFESCFKMKNKGEALPLAMRVARKRWDYLSKTKIQDCKREEMFHGVYTIGARNKRDHTYEDDELAVSRAVHMPEFHVELTSAPWFDSFTNMIKKKQKGPIYIGNSILRSERLRTDTEDSKFILEGDFKRFDSTLYLIAITCGLSFIRCFFDLNSSYVDSHFCGIYDSIAIKDYYTVGGKVFRLFHGLPSGVKSTSLLGSVINLMALAFCVEKNLRAFNFIIGGDDFLIVSKASCENYEMFIDKIKERVTMLGMNFKFLDVKFFESSELKECPTFYKYTIYKGKAVTPTQSALERVLMPWNKNYNTDSKLFEFMQDVMPSMGEPMSHLYIYYRFYQMLYKKITKSDISLATIYNKHSDVFRRMQVSKDRKTLYKYKERKTDGVVSAVSYIIKDVKAKEDIKGDETIFL